MWNQNDGLLSPGGADGFGRALMRQGAVNQTPGITPANGPGMGANRWNFGDTRPGGGDVGPGPAPGGGIGGGGPLPLGPMLGGGSYQGPARPYQYTQADMNWHPSSGPFGTPSFLNNPMNPTGTTQGTIDDGGMGPGGGPFGGGGGPLPLGPGAGDHTGMSWVPDHLGGNGPNTGHWIQSGPAWNPSDHPLDQFMSGPFGPKPAEGGLGGGGFQPMGSPHGGYIPPGPPGGSYGPGEGNPKFGPTPDPVNPWGGRGNSYGPGDRLQGDPGARVLQRPRGNMMANPWGNQGNGMNAPAFHWGLPNLPRY